MNREKGLYKSIKDYRNLAELQQKELALLSSITQPYLSEIEMNSKPFTKEAAEKIAIAFSMFLSGPGNPVHIEPGILRASHIASFLPKDDQAVANELISGIAYLEDCLEDVLAGRDYNRGDISINFENNSEGLVMRIYKHRSGPDYIAETIIGCKGWIGEHKARLIKLAEQEKAKAKNSYQEKVYELLSKDYNFDENE